MRFVKRFGVLFSISTIIAIIAIIYLNNPAHLIVGSWWGKPEFSDEAIKAIKIEVANKPMRRDRPPIVNVEKDLKNTSVGFNFTRDGKYFISCKSEREAAVLEGSWTFDKESNSVFLTRAKESYATEYLYKMDPISARIIKLFQNHELKVTYLSATNQLLWKNSDCKVIMSWSHPN